jgi:hypothetical protein
MMEKQAGPLVAQKFVDFQRDGMRQAGGARLQRRSTTELSC